jgi:hypothetical protein
VLLVTAAVFQADDVQGVALDGRVVWERMYCTGECPVPERTAGGVVRIVDAQDGRVRAIVRVPR